jgi:hypothetical protein
LSYIGLAVAKLPSTPIEVTSRLVRADSGEPGEQLPISGALRVVTIEGQSAVELAVSVNDYRRIT